MWTAVTNRKAVFLHWHTAWHVVAHKRAVCDSLLSYCSKRDSIIIARSDTVSSYWAICFRGFNSVECRICWSGTLTRKCLLSTTCNLVFFFTSWHVSCFSGSVFTSELVGRWQSRLRSLSISNCACSNESSTLLSAESPLATQGKGRENMKIVTRTKPFFFGFLKFWIFFKH